jgi:hypothetical protein
VTVASAEKRFSKLKLLKNHLRPLMSQERLNGLIILCIEKHMLDDIHTYSIIIEFASRELEETISSDLRNLVIFTILDNELV